MMMQVLNQQFIPEIIQLAQQENAVWEIKQFMSDIVQVSVAFPEKPKFFQETRDLEETWEDLCVHVGKKHLMKERQTDLKKFMIEQLMKSDDELTVVTHKGFCNDRFDLMNKLKEVNVRFEQSFVTNWGKLSIKFRGGMSETMYDNLKVVKK